jgi:hypothetical protein
MRGRGLMLIAGMKMGQKQAAKAGELKQQGADEARQKAAEAQAASPGMNDTTIAQLQKLADLKNSGVLSDEEFTAAKKKLLNL